MLIRLVFGVFLAIVVLAPLPYGSVHLWSSNLLALVAGFALLLWVTASVRSGEFIVQPKQYRLPLVLLAGVLIWVVLQAVSFTPTALHHPIWAKSAAAFGEDVRGSISVTPEASIASTTRVLTYAIVFWLAMHLGRDPRRAHLIYWAIATAGFLYATYGLWVHLSGSGKILLADKWAYQLSLTSTFVNRNHYGVFGGMGLLVSFGLLVRYLKQDATGAFDSSRRFLNSLENLRWPVFVLTVFCLVIGSAVLYTRSRGAVAFSGIGMISLVLLLHASGKMRKRSSFALAGTLVVGGLLMLLLSGEGFVERAASKLWESDRAQVREIAMTAIADAPLTGHGVGSFPAVFQLYRSPDFEAVSPAYSAAHNVYLEFAAGAGLPAAAAYFGMLAWIIVRCFRGAFARRRSQYYPAIGWAVGVLVALHSYFDFGPQIPGVSVTFAAILGVAFAQSWSNSHRSRQSGER